MNFTNEQRERIWRRYFGTSYSVIDAFGRQMSFDNFQADHIWPQSKGGSSVVENGIPLSALSNEEKSDGIKGVINGKSFQVFNAGVSERNVGTLKVNGYTVSKL